MFQDLRQDLGMPQLPIVIGQLGDFLGTEKYPYVETVRKAIQHIPAVVPNAGYAEATGLTDKGDKLHFSASAEKEFGTRFARVMAALSPAQPATLTPAAVVDVWPEGKMPGHGAHEPEGDVPARGDNVRRITNISRPTLTLFPAGKKDSPAPAMIVCPGGGYSYVVYDKEGTEIAAWLNSLGISALILKYRTPNNRDGAFQDIQRALSLTRTHAAEWNLDPKRLGVIGFSAGGNLAAKASTLFDQRAYAPIDAVDQESCRPDFAVLVYPAYLEKEGKVASNLPIKAGVPPTLIVHSEDDKSFIAGSKLYHAALDAAKVANTFLLYPTGGHGYGLRSPKEARVWPQEAEPWFRKIGVR